MSAKSKVQQLAREAYDRGDPIGWFDQVYRLAQGDLSQVPWARQQPNEHLANWLANRAAPVAGVQASAPATALVVACGAGDDAAWLSRSGFTVTAFDVSGCAIECAQQRFADAGVQFCVADLLHPPPEWQGAFGLVFEAYTLQALPWKLRQQAARRMASFVAPGGELLVVCYGREEDEDAGQLPWPLSQSELNAFSEAGLEEVNFQDVTGERGIREFVVTFRRPAP